MKTIKKLKFFKIAIKFGILGLASVACKQESTVDTTTPAVANPYPANGIVLAATNGPRLRFHDGGVADNAPSLFPNWPEMPQFEKSQWYIAQWKKNEIMRPEVFYANPSDVTDSALGAALYAFPTATNESHIWIFKDKSDKFVYELYGQHGWLDTMGGSNVFLSTSFPVTDFSSRIDLNFNAKIAKRITSYGTQGSDRDGSVVSQFISGMPLYFSDPTGESSNINLFMQITHGDSREPNFLAPGKLSYTGCYANDFGQKQIVYGDNAPNALGGNGFIANEDPNGTLVPYSYNLNSAICKMLKKTFNCPNGERLAFPAAAYDLKNWHMGSYYTGIETQDALADVMTVVPTVRGPARGAVAIGVQISELKLMKYPQEISTICDGKPAGNICIPNSQVECKVDHGLGKMNCSADGQTLSQCVSASCENGFILKNGACEEVLTNHYSEGAFCSGTHQILFQCGRVTSPGAGWVAQGSDCYHKDNGEAVNCK